MSDTPRKTLYFDLEYTERDGLYKVDGNDYVDGEDARRLEAELAAATARVAALTDKDLCKMGQSPCEYALTLIARAESAERDALQRAADICHRKAGSIPDQYTYTEAALLDCRDAILALLPKERT